MIYFTDEKIDAFIKEDVPTIDLTTTLMGIGNTKGMLEFRVREDGVVAIATSSIFHGKPMDIAAKMSVCV